VLPLDVLEFGSHTRAVDTIVKAFGRIDILVRRTRGASPAVTVHVVVVVEVEGGGVAM
jgi:hypothetical protein